MSNEQELQEWVRQHLARSAGVAPESIVFDRKLGDYGLDSVDAVLMAGELEDHFGIEIDPASFIQHTNFETMLSSLNTAVQAKRQRASGGVREDSLSDSSLASGPSISP
jgi:acyl carrier protein